MAGIVDLRKVSIKTPEDAIAFLELFASKAPDIKRVLNEQKLKQISMENHLRVAQERSGKATIAKVDEDTDDVGLLGRLQGQHRSPAKTAAASRLAQMKAAQDKPKAEEPVDKPVDTGDKSKDELPPAPAAPGQIGQLEVDPAQTGTPDEAAQADADIPPAGPNDEGDDPGDRGASDDTVSQEDAAKAAGSKSERTTDDGVQSTDTEEPSDEDQEELSDEDKAKLLAPTDDDKTSIGTKAARATKKNK